MPVLRKVVLCDARRPAVLLDALQAERAQPERGIQSKPREVYARALQAGGEGARKVQPATGGECFQSAARPAERTQIAMSLFRYKGSKVWTMDFVIHGQR